MSSHIINLILNITTDALYTDPVTQILWFCFSRILDLGTKVMDFSGTPNHLFLESLKYHSTIIINDYLLILRIEHILITLKS